jgi:hypothetical protein
LTSNPGQCLHDGSSHGNPSPVAMRHGVTPPLDTMTMGDPPKAHVHPPHHVDPYHPPQNVPPPPYDMQPRGYGYVEPSCVY